jgi:beta-xylosidase
VVSANAVAWLDLRHQRDELASARHDIATTQRQTGRTRDVLAQTATAVATRGAERDQARDSAALTGETLLAAQGSVNAAQGTAFVQQGQIGALSTCIGGVQTSLGFLGGGNRASAITTLQNVSLACNAAVGATGGSRPVFAFDFPDPYVLRVGTAYYAYATNAGAGDIQVAKSTDLRNWVFVGNALAGLPRWAAPYRTWAPSVLPRATGTATTYIAYYTAQNGKTGPQCISRAVAASPEGPFVDDTPGPMICPRHGDAIDPSPFVDADGSAYLTWRGVDARIWSQRLAADGLSLQGDAHALVRPDQPWEGKVVEGPSMVRAAGHYYLFYSANEWRGRDYAVGYAVCDSPAGPCAKPSQTAAFGSSGTIIGPGGQEFFTDGGGQLWMAYHAYTDPNVGYPNSRRLHLMRVAFDPSGVPVLQPSG